jgi:membrane fusion protein, multidrug efflux system
MKRPGLVILAATAVTLLPYSAFGANDPLECVISPKATIELASPDEGILADLLVERGDVVAKGQAVARLDQRLEQLAVEATRVRAQSDVELRFMQAQVEYYTQQVQRMGELLERAGVSRQAYDETEIELRLATISLERAELEHRIAQVDYERARVQLDRRLIHSPVDGVIVEVIMSPGEFTHRQAPLMIIAEIDPLNVEVFVPLERFGTIHTGMSAEIRPRTLQGGETYAATVTVVDPVLDEVAGARRAA